MVDLYNTSGYSYFKLDVNWTEDILDKQIEGLSIFLVRKLVDFMKYERLDGSQDKFTGKMFLRECAGAE